MPEINLPTKALQDSISINVGSNTDTASATGSVHAKLKDIKNNLSSSGGGGGGIKSVQRGIATNNPINITISSVNMSKTFINVMPFAINTVGQAANDVNVIGRLTSSTNLMIYTSNAIKENKILWEVIEFN